MIIVNEVFLISEINWFIIVGIIDLNVCGKMIVCIVFI